MFGCHRLISVSLAILTLLFGRIPENCQSTVNVLDDFNSKIQNMEIEHYDSTIYERLTGQYKDIKGQINRSPCSETIKDSLLIDFTTYFAEKVCRNSGDLPQYIALWKEAAKICSTNISRRKLTADSSRMDYYQSFISGFEVNRERLNDEYGSLVIAFDPDLTKLESMGVVLNRITNQPISIHIQPPISILNDQEKQNRLAFISGEFQLDFSEIDPRIGFVKMIKYLPKNVKSGIQERGQDILESYAFTFEKVARYRSKQNSDGDFDTLYIKPRDDWVLIERIPENIAILKLPQNIDYMVFVAETPRHDLMDRDENTVYLEPGADNLEILLTKNMSKTMYMFFRVVIIAAVTIGPIFIL